ncbi:MAG: hypothetical protein E6Q24_19495 [Chitinophagaceae bacterium]|nr:MAG: hypothetical protein E6Q24_19495 [Chitinophagaceae bacterium]
MKKRYVTPKTSSLLLVICLALSFGSCNSQQRKVDNSSPTQLELSNSVTRDIPKFFQGEKWNRYFADMQSSLNLHSLRNGVEGWQIRLWIAHAVYDYKDSAQLIIFKKEDGIIRGILYTYIVQNEPLRDTSSIRTAGKFTALLPKSDWASVVDSLERLSVFTLPDYTKIKGYYLATDSFGIVIEVAKGNTYRIYEYPDYEQHVDTLPEAQKLLQILKLIEREFGIDVTY